MTTRRNRRNLEVVVSADSRRLQGGLRDASRQVQSFDQQVDQASRTGIGRFNSSMDVAIQRLKGFVGVAAAAAAGRALFNWAQDVRESANALTESVNAVQTVFEEGSDTVLEFGEDSATSVGLARSAFQQAVVPIGSLLRNFGFDAEEAAEAAVILTQRAADMASVFNTDVDQALEAIQAALRGESDPIERFGASISAARVETFLLNEGLVNSKSEIDDTMKVMGRYRLILQDTERVAGDFAATAHEDANATRIFEARLEDLRARAGQQVIPLFEELRRGGEGALPVFEAFADDVLPTLVNVFADFIAGVSEVIDFIGRIPGEVVAATAAIGALAGALVFLNSHPVIAAFTAIVTGITLIGSAAREERTQVEELTEAIRILLEQGDRDPLSLEIRQDLVGAIQETEELQEALRLLRGQGITFDDLISFVEGDVDAIERIRDAVQGFRDVADQPGAGLDAQAIAESGAVSELLNVLDSQRKRREEVEEATRAQLDAERDLADEGEFFDKQTQQRLRNEAEATDKLKTSISEMTDAELQALEARKLRTFELDEAIGALADSYAQQLNSALTNYIDLAKEAGEVETISAGQQLENVEEQVRRIEEFTAGLERLREEGLTTLAEDIAARGPEALGALRGLIEDLDAEGSRAFELNQLIEESESEIARFSEQFGLDLASEKVGMLAEMQNLGVDLGEALAKGLESTNITLGITARAKGLRARALGPAEPGGGGVQFRASGGRYMPGALVTGERGPELQFPDRGGFIATQQFVADTLRTAASGGGGGFNWFGNLIVDARGANDPEAVGRATVRALDRKLDTFRRGMPERRV